jgi:hypothetical protein
MVEMKRRTALLLPLVAVMAVMAAGCSVIGGKTTGDIVVLPLGDEVRVTEGSVVYALPLTVFEIDVTAEKRIEIPGPYARYAEEMTGLDKVITAEDESWSLVDVSLNTIEELDPSQFYVIQGTTLMQTNMLALRKNGLVLDINPNLYDHAAYSHLQNGTDYAGPLFPDRGAYEYVSTKTDTAYRLVKADTAFIRVPYLVQKKQGMTVETEAREAADRLLELREGRHMILTGETNIFPQDGAAIDEINRLEREYMALFAGKTWTERKHFRIWVTPDLSMAGSKTTIFTFSENLGVNTSAGGPGEPVQMEIIPSGKTRELNLIMTPVSSQKELSATDKLYYRVPDVAEITLTIGEERLCTARKLIYQFGNTVTLPSNFIIGK